MVVVVCYHGYVGYKEVGHYHYEKRRTKWIGKEREVKVKICRDKKDEYGVPGMRCF